MLWLSGEDEDGTIYRQDYLTGDWEKLETADQFENCSAGFSVHLVFFLRER